MSLAGARILTVAVADSDPDLDMIPGTITRPCAECSRPCYLAPSSIPAADAGAAVTCGPCTERLIAAGEGADVALGILPGALAELARHPGHNQRSRKPGPDA